MVVQVYSKEVAMVFQKGFKGVSKLVSKVFHASFKVVSRVCQEVEWFC